MHQEVYVEPAKGSFPDGESIVSELPEVYGNGIPCQQTECIYCLNNHYCCRTLPPRNPDGYCKDFISIND